MGTAIFNKADHTYTLDGKVLISVTQLMRKHGLAPSYEGIDEEVLRRKAERGSLIHEEIERYIKHGEIGFTSEQEDFARFVSELGITNMRSEEIVNNDLVAGTADLMAIRTLKSEQGVEYINRVLVDYKTSVNVNKEAVSWQLSLYEHLSGEQFDEFYVFHLLEHSEKSKYIPLEHIPAEEVEKLLQCEREGTIYQPRALSVPSELLAAAQEAERAVKVAEAIKKEAEARAVTIRQQLIEAMEAQGIKSFETADKSMLITYVEPSIRETIDSTRLKKERPEVAAEYSKKSTVKASVRITVRG